MGGHREGKGPVEVLLAPTWILHFLQELVISTITDTSALSPGYFLNSPPLVFCILEAPGGFSIVLTKVPWAQLTQAQHGLIDLASSLLAQKPRVVALDGEQSHAP